MTTDKAVDAPTHHRRTLAGARQVGAAPTLWHYSCHHFEESIRAVGAIIPHRHPLFPTLGAVAWLTTDRWVEDPDRAGLTSSLLACDRTKFRFRVTEADTCLPWTQVRDLYVAALQPGFDPTTIRTFEMFGAPTTWWLSPVPVPVVAA